VEEEAAGGLCVSFNTSISLVSRPSMSHPSIISSAFYPSRMEEFRPTHFPVCGLFQCGLWCFHSLDIYISPTISIREWYNKWLRYWDLIENWVPGPLGHPYCYIIGTITKVSNIISFLKCLERKLPHIVVYFQFLTCLTHRWLFWL
jgi:hypothetical protein